RKSRSGSGASESCRMVQRSRLANSSLMSPGWVGGQFSRSPVSPGRLKQAQIKLIPSQRTIGWQIEYISRQISITSFPDPHCPHHVHPRRGGIGQLGRGNVGALVGLVDLGNKVSSCGVSSVTSQQETTSIGRERLQNA